LILSVYWINNPKDCRPKNEVLNNVAHDGWLGRKMVKTIGPDSSEFLNHSGHLLSSRNEVASTSGTIVIGCGAKFIHGNCQPVQTSPNRQIPSGSRFPAQ
jgi:hypothetical protein